MISKDNIENCKEILFNEYDSKESFIIGDLNRLRNLLDTVLNDTSYNKFRIVEACHWLHNQGYLNYKNSADDKNMFGIIIFFITPKLVEEMKDKRNKQEEEENKNLRSWY